MTESITDLKRQIQQIDSLLLAKSLSPDAAANARADLERRLVAAVMAGGSASPAATPAAALSKPSRGLVAGLVAFVLIFGAAGYAWRGGSGVVNTGAGANAVAGAPPDAAASDAAPTAAQIEEMLKGLSDRLKTRPDDAAGWMMLGRSYAVLGRHAEAVPAFRQVIALQPKNAQALADLADALTMTQNRNFSGEPTRLIAAALQIEPDNQKALTLSGTVAYDNKDYAGAVRQWERVIANGPADSELVRQLRENIPEVRRLAGLPPATSAPTANPAAQAAGAKVSGRVELDPALAAKAAPGDTVFIFARPATGARMPLAILKKQVRDLPFDFSLDDSMAMSPAATLSQAEAVVVGARVSKSGQAMPQPGDLQGLSVAVKPGASGLRIVIAEEVR